MAIANRGPPQRHAAPWKCRLATGTHRAPLFDPYCARCQVSFLWRLLGEEGVFAITFWGDIPDADLERIAAAFPEVVEVTRKGDNLDAARQARDHAPWLGL
jgi:hypothetical protein